MPDEAARYFRCKQYARTFGRNLARTESSDRTVCCLRADPLDRFEICCIARGAVPVVPFHVAIFLADDDTTDAVAGLWIAGDESMGIGVRANTIRAADGGSLGIGDALVEASGSIFAFDCHAYRFIRGQLPRPFKLQIGNVSRHQFCICQPCVLVCRSKARERTGLCHRLAQRRRAEIGCARVTLLVVFVDGNAESAIIRILETLHVTQARSRTHAGIVTGGHLCLVHALASRLVDHERHQVFKFPCIEQYLPGYGIHA